MKLWPHQEYAIDQCLQRVNSGTPCRTVVSANTGAGKSKMMTDIIVRSRARVSLYTHRKMLLSQTSAVLTQAKIEHGVRAAGYEQAREHRVQLCSTQTISSRIKKGGENVHQSDLILIDESHVQKSGSMIDILDRHGDAHVIGFTATPVEIGHIYQDMIQAGTTSSLRDCGALLPAMHFAPSEIDCSKIKPGKSGDFSQNDIRKIWVPPVIFGNVLQHFLKLNPGLKPTILFAPGVAESQYLAEKFCDNGIPAAHISGETIWINGGVYETTQENKDMLAAMSECGDIKVVCNRFVMREGIDWPWLSHLIFATPFGSVCSYLQAGGRVLRNHPDLESTTVIDHGGNYWRHGSLNEDRVWQLDDTANIIRSEREQRIREKKEPEPIVCPKCFQVRLHGPRCHRCGMMHSDRRRAVIQADGSLRQMKVAKFKPRRQYQGSDLQKLWDSYYFRGKKSRNRMNFNQSVALFAQENNWAWPGRELKNMPISDRDWHRPIADVSRESLR